MRTASSSLSQDFMQERIEPGEDGALLVFKVNFHVKDNESGALSMTLLTEPRRINIIYIKSETLSRRDNQKRDGFKLEAPRSHFFPKLKPTSFICLSSWGNNNRD